MQIQICPLNNKYFIHLASKKADMHLKLIVLTKIFLLFTLIESQSFAQTIRKGKSEVYQQKLDSIFNSWNREDAPGGAVAIISKGKVIYKKGFGMADVNGKINNSPETQFYIASMAKQFTGMCIALLEENGKLSVDDNLSKYYPQFNFLAKITLRNLLDHSSGIREAYVLAMLSGKRNLKGKVPEKYQTKEYLLKVLAREKDLNFMPGEEIVYTNVNYILLGDIVAQVSGVSLRQFADSAIFRPLGMRNTFFNDDPAFTIPKAAVGYSYKSENKFKKGKLKGGVVGDHNLVSTVEDLILWDQNFYHNQLGKKQKQLIETMTTGSKLNDGKPTNYGYGLWIENFRGLPTVFHGGDNGLHTSCILRFPEQEFTVICLANSSRYSDTHQKADEVANLFLSPYFNKPVKGLETFNFIEVNLSELRDKPGLYTFLDTKGMGHMRKVSLKDNNLYISDSYYHNGLKLSALDARHFVAKNPNGEYFYVDFSMNDAGEITLTEKFRSREVTLTQFHDASVLHNFEEYDGTYFNPSVEATIKIKAKKDRIIARKGTLKIPLIFFGKDVFYAPQNSATFHFVRNQQENIYQIIVNASDFRNFKFEKK